MRSVGAAIVVCGTFWARVGKRYFEVNEGQILMSRRVLCRYLSYLSMKGLINDSMIYLRLLAL